MCTIKLEDEIKKLILDDDVTKKIAVKQILKTVRCFAGNVTEGNLTSSVKPLISESQSSPVLRKLCLLLPDISVFL